MICTNTMHKMAGDVQAAVSIPLIHIGDATAEAIREAGVHRPLLLATRYTMEQDFYKGFLREKHGIGRGGARRARTHARAQHHLQRAVPGHHLAGVEAGYLDVIAQADGIDSVIFGCTEVGLLLSPDDLDLPAFDTTALHARAALDFALSIRTSPTAASAAMRTLRNTTGKPAR